MIVFLVNFYNALNSISWTFQDLRLSWQRKLVTSYSSDVWKSSPADRVGRLWWGGGSHDDDCENGNNDDDDDDEDDDDDFLWQPHEAGTTYVALTANICSLLRLLTALWSTSTHRQCTACTAAYNTIFLHTILYHPMIFVQNNDIYSYSSHNIYINYLSVFFISPSLHHFLPRSKIDQNTSEEGKRSPRRLTGKKISG